VQINKFAEPALLQPLVEPDQISMVHHCPRLIKRIVYMGIGQYFHVKPIIFVGGQNREFSFFLIETKKTFFLLNF